MHDILLFMQHHLALCVALIVILFILVVLEFIKLQKATKSLSPTQAIQLINRQNAAIIDIRNPEAFANGHIVGSVSLPLIELKESTKKIQKWISQPILVVCANGVDSQIAAKILEKNGFNVQLLNGGLRSWQQASMPLTKD